MTMTFLLNLPGIQTSDSNLFAVFIPENPSITQGDEQTYMFR